MSKSVGNVVDPAVMVDRFGVDAVRFYLLHEAPMLNDGDYSEAELRKRLNADLADHLGNLLSRSVSPLLLPEGRIPLPHGFSEADRSLIAEIAALPDAVGAFYDKLDFAAGLRRIMHVAIRLNQFFTVNQPWLLRKTNPDRLGTVLFIVLEGLKIMGILLQPIMPQSACTMLDALCVSKRSFCDCKFDEAGLNASRQPLNQHVCLFLKQKASASSVPTPQRAVKSKKKLKTVHH
eukprot:TRINITY_DN3178_c0_g2_i1.p1 TRINITY_DN3178_c0_g2~~TRINITY_DN3178_c0_g2_i1.p1  ORF type:complete len:252 (-),score=36.04 TRINITY_DN3178_c0_g2_i1:80-781(-)